LTAAVAAVAAVAAATFVGLLLFRGKNFGYLSTQMKDCSQEVIEICVSYFFMGNYKSR
jgi:hypothetical protein